MTPLLWGFVDEADFLVQTTFEGADDDVILLPYDSRDAARSVLEAERIDAYVVIPADYRETSGVELIFIESPPHEAMRHFERVVKLNILSGQDPAVVERMLSGADVNVRATESNREFPSGGPSAGQILPILIAVIFAFLVMTTAGYMMQIVMREKENRTMEIIISSVSPGRMMTGKIIGILGIAFIQIVIWLIFFAVAIWFGINILKIEWLRDIKLVWQDLIPIVLIAVPTYIFMAALMTSIGSSLTDSQEAEQLGPLLFLILLLPVYLILPISSNPNGPLALILSFFPGTSVITIAARSLFIEVPGWQIAVALVITIVFAVTAVWLAGKAFRMSMLRYGQRLKLLEIVGQKRSF